MKWIKNTCCVSGAAPFVLLFREVSGVVKGRGKTDRMTITDHPPHTLEDKDPPTPICPLRSPICVVTMKQTFSHIDALNITSDLLDKHSSHFSLTYINKFDRLQPAKLFVLVFIVDHWGKGVPEKTFLQSPASQLYNFTSLVCSSSFLRSINKHRV